MVTIRRLEHPDAVIRQVGFPIDHRYVEVVWGTGVGPSVVHLLRQLPLLWVGGDSLQMPAGELDSGLGFPGKGSLERTLKRVVRFGLGERRDRLEFGVYSKVPHAPRGFVRQAPDWVVTVHEHFVSGRGPQATQGDQAGGVSTVKARLDQLQRPANPQAPSSPPLTR